MLKRCARCHEHKVLDAFGNNRSRKDGKCVYCLTCEAAARYDSTEQRAERRLQAQYGIGLAQYDAMFAAQLGRCAICDQPETALAHGATCRLSVDHNHETGQVRALLCRACNVAIGAFQEDKQRLRAAAEYLEKFETVDPAA